MRRLRTAPFWACSAVLHLLVGVVLMQLVWERARKEPAEVPLIMVVRQAAPPEQVTRDLAAERDPAQTKAVPLPLDTALDERAFLEHRRSPKRPPVRDVLPEISRGTALEELVGVELASRGAEETGPFVRRADQSSPAPAASQGGGGAVGVGARQGAASGPAPSGPRAAAVRTAPIATSGGARAGSPPGGAGGERVYGVGDVDEPPVRTTYVAPVYPPQARRFGLAGWARLSFVVAADGTVRDIAVTESEPRETFDGPAREALAQWVFRPGKFRGRPVPVRCTVKITFRLGE